MRIIFSTNQWQRENLVGLGLTVLVFVALFLWAFTSQVRQNSKAIKQEVCQLGVIGVEQ